MTDKRLQQIIDAYRRMQKAMAITDSIFGKPGEHLLTNQTVIIGELLKEVGTLLFLINHSSEDEAYRCQHGKHSKFCGANWEQVMNG